MTSILCLSHQCILGTDNLILEFHRLTNEGNCAYGWILPRVLPKSDLDLELNDMI